MSYITLQKHRFVTSFKHSIFSSFVLIQYTVIIEKRSDKNEIKYVENRACTNSNSVGIRITCIVVVGKQKRCILSVRRNMDLVSSAGGSRNLDRFKSCGRRYYTRSIQRKRRNR